MLRKTLFSGLVLAMLGFACSGDNKTTSETAAQAGEAISVQDESDNAADAGSETHGEIRLVMTGGDMAGTYEAVCREACCSYGLAGEETFGMQYSETGKAEKELSSVQMIVEGASDDVNTEHFLVTISFGELFGGNSKSFTIDTRKDWEKRGSGTIDIDYSGKTATVKLKGKTAEGVEVALDIKCSSIYNR